MDKKIIIFDLDGTLTPSKSALRASMAENLLTLLKLKKVGVISGGSFDQFKIQFLGNLPAGEKELQNLYLMPTSGALLIEYRNGAWNAVYENMLSIEEKTRIYNAIDRAIQETGFEMPVEKYGDRIEDRGGSVAFSALGQKAPLPVKSAWDPDQNKRRPVVHKLLELLPEFDIRMGGTSTIDITKKGINKAYAVRRLLEHLKLETTQALYVGDALYPHGNDEIVKETGVETIQVSGPSETEQIIARIIAQTAKI